MTGLNDKSRKVLLAGATGVIGRRLLPLLRQRGYDVVATTRSAARADGLRRDGVSAIVVDAYDQPALIQALASVEPAVVIHQLTDLSNGFAPDRVAETLARNARLRTEGTRNLMVAARAAGVSRVIAQSIVWIYVGGAEPHVETDAVNPALHGVVALEQAVLGTPPIQGVVLRYGWFYGPGANEKPAGTPGVHVDAAAQAAVLAIDHGAPGAYNVAEPSPYASTERVRRELGWDPAFRQQ